MSFLNSSTGTPFRPEAFLFFIFSEWFLYFLHRYSISSRILISSVVSISIAFLSCVFITVCFCFLVSFYLFFAIPFCPCYLCLIFNFRHFLSFCPAFGCLFTSLFDLAYCFRSSLYLPHIRDQAIIVGGFFQTSYICILTLAFKLPKRMSSFLWLTEAKTPH